MKEIIYVSEYSGYSPIRSDGTRIAQFRPYEVFDPNKGLVQKGVLVLDIDDPKQKAVSEELEAFSDFGKGFVKVDKLPTKANSEGNIITGLRTGHEADEAKKSLVPLIKERDELRAKLLKADGSLKQGATDEDISRLEKIESDLGLGG